MIKSWPKLIFSILLAQSTGLVGTVFTINSIPTWFATLTRPPFAPPNWIFGPVWTILYTLIGISLYLIWTSKKGSLKLFLFHLILNAIWSPIFFGLNNLGLALFVIILMDITLVVIIKNFYKINKIAALILIPYLMWISFATVLNFSFWQLNPKTINAQDLTFQKSRQDYIFIEDNYKTDLFDFNLKKGSYQKNPTLSNKEEARLSLYKLIGIRNKYIESYLTMLRVRTVESNGIIASDKNAITSIIDPEVVWYVSRKNNYSELDILENILLKSQEEDLRYTDSTTPAFYFALTHISLGDVRDLKAKSEVLYAKLKVEANDLIKLGRADAGLFDRWFIDIDKELENLLQIEKKVKVEIEKIVGPDEYKRRGSYQKALDELEPAISSLLRLNGFIKELEIVIQSKR